MAGLAGPVGRGRRKTKRTLYASGNREKQTEEIRDN